MHQPYLFGQKFLHFCGYILYLLCRLKTGDHKTALADKELGEVPLDVGTLTPVGILLVKHLHQDGSYLVGHIEACKAFLLLEILEQRISVGAVDLQLLELRKIGAIVELAELMDALISTGSLLTKLITGEVEYLEALRMVFLVQILQLGVGGRKPTSCGCVHYEEHFVGILFQRDHLSLAVFN